MNSPCERCTLPDCDERSKMCALRRAANLVDSKRRRGKAHTITPDEHAAYNEHFHIWKLEDLARKSERQLGAEA